MASTPERLGLAADRGTVDRLIEAVEAVADVTPDRVVGRFGHRSMNYRELVKAVSSLVAITRAHGMDDQSAVVAAIFAGLPTLQTGSAAEVSAVIEGALAQVRSDHTDLSDVLTDHTQEDVLQPFDLGVV